MAAVTANFVSMAPRPRILIVEEGGLLTNDLASSLQREGYETVIAHDRHQGIRQAQAIGPDIIVLDLVASAADGLDVGRIIRETDPTRDTPILVLTMKDSRQQSAAKADGRVIRPVTIKALVQRLKELRRRRSEADQAEVIENLGIRIDRIRYQAYAEERNLNLTPTQYRLLETLLRQPGRVFTWLQLVEAASGEGTLILDRTIDCHIKGLRQKLNAAGDLIETVRGVDYRFREARWR